jgi:hypothetical protein
MNQPNRPQSNTLLAPVGQEGGTIELSWEQLEVIQGGGWFRRKVIRAVVKFVRNIFD